MTSCSSVGTTIKCKVKRMKLHHPAAPGVHLLQTGSTSIADCPQHGPRVSSLAHRGFGETFDLQKSLNKTGRSPAEKNPAGSKQFQDFPAEPSDISSKHSSLESRSTASTVLASNKPQQSLQHRDNALNASLISRNGDMMFLRSCVSIPVSQTSSKYRENTNHFPKEKLGFSCGDMKTIPKGLQKYQWNQHNQNNHLNSFDESVKRAGQMISSHSGMANNGLVDFCLSSKNALGFSRRSVERYVDGQIPRIENLLSCESRDICRERSVDGNKNSRSKTGLINKMPGISNIIIESSNRNLKLKSCQRQSEDLKPAQNEEADSEATRKTTKVRKGKETLNEHKSRSRSRSSIENRRKISHSSIISICSKIRKKHKITIPRDKDAAAKMKDPVSKHEMNKHNVICTQAFSTSTSSASDMSSVKKTQKVRIKKIESSESSSFSSSSDCIHPVERPSKKISNRGEQRMKSNTKQETADSCYRSQTAMYSKPDSNPACSKDLKNRKSPTKLKLLYSKERRHADSSSMLSRDGSTLIEVFPHDQHHEKNRAKKVSAGVEKGAVEAEGEKSWSLKQTLSSWAYKISGGSWSLDEKYPTTVRSNPPTSRSPRENASRKTNLYEEKPNRNVCQKESKDRKRTVMTESKEMCKKEMPSKTECLSCKHKKKSNKREVSEITSQSETETEQPLLVGGGLQETKWAITQINIFKDGSKTYAIAQPSNRKPKHFSTKTVRIFVTVPQSSDYKRTKRN